MPMLADAHISSLGYLCSDFLTKVVRFQRVRVNQKNCWFSHDVTNIQSTKLSILPRFYFHNVSEQLKTNFHTNFRFKRVLGFVIRGIYMTAKRVVT